MHAAVGMTFYLWNSLYTSRLEYYSQHSGQFVKQIVSEYDWSCHDESAYNPGTLIITEEWKH